MMTTEVTMNDGRFQKRKEKIMSAVAGLHGLWERGWPVTPENIQKMCANGSHALISRRDAERAIEQIQPGDREAWLAYFTPKPGFSQADWSTRYAAWLQQPIWTAK
jgi:hypothetical protein